MSYQLGSITLPRPIRFEKIPVEISVKHTTLDGSLKKDIFGRKYKYILYFQHLTQSEVTDILNEYNLQEIRTFSVSDGNLTISPTDVHIEISRREHNVPGSDYREDLILVLEEA